MRLIVHSEIFFYRFKQTFFFDIQNYQVNSNKCWLVEIILKFIKGTKHSVGSDKTLVNCKSIDLWDWFDQIFVASSKLFSSKCDY